MFVSARIRVRVDAVDTGKSVSDLHLPGKFFYMKVHEHD